MISKHELDEKEKYLPWTELPEKVAQRRLKVRRYLRKGYTKSKIAILTKVSNMTIFRDIRWMSDNKINIIVNFKPQERIADSISLYKEVEDYSNYLIFNIISNIAKIIGIINLNYSGGEVLRGRTSNFIDAIDIG